MARVTSTCVIVACAMPAGAAHAADASPWDEDARSGARLIAGNPDHGGTLRAGVEIRLAPGWKTYWRYPGDSGVPPRFDFSGSRNVKSVTVAWPAPHRAHDESGTTIVYQDGVIFPLRVVAQDAEKPVELSLKLDYAVCHDICIPKDAKAELALERKASALDVALAAAEALVPKPAKLGDNAPLTVRSVRREGSGAHPRVVVEVAGPAPVDLFAEGPTPDWALPVPEPVAGAPAGLHRFAFLVDGVPPGAKADGAVLTFTLTSGAGAIEVKAPLD
ncbi:MAG TPA: protein-disulfide reductase DsbD domain-containing protein [Xanthobacteraceae bacterium]